MLAVTQDRVEQDQRLSGVFENERRRLLAFIGRRIPSEIDAEDLLQDVFIELVEAYRLMKPIAHVGAWMMQVARNRITDMFRRDRGYLKPPIDDIESYWTPTEKVQASRMLNCSFVGSPKTVESALKQFIDRTGIDELMVSSAIYDHAARLRSYELLAKLRLHQADSVEK